jgi:translation initiation factor 1 (eIF-1/SUI1)
VDQPVTITIEPFRKKWKTSVTGLAEANKALHASWKKKLSCGGDFSAGRMCFQGDHSQTVYDWIIKLGYSKDRILITGTGK